MQDAEHIPVMVYARDDEFQVGVPAEICYACSDTDAGRLVPASFCERAKARLDPAPWES